MDSPSVVQTVAAALAHFMRRAEIKEAALGKKAGVSPRTVGNFLRPHLRQPGASGKAPSGKLTELEMIARALGIQVVDLVGFKTPEEAEQEQQFREAVRLMLQAAQKQEQQAVPHAAPVQAAPARRPSGEFNPLQSSDTPRRAVA